MGTLRNLRQNHSVDTTRDSVLRSFGSCMIEPFCRKGSKMDHIATNRDSWDRRTEIHFTSEMYDVDGFLNGDCKLKEIELVHR